MSRKKIRATLDQLKVVFGAGSRMMAEATTAHLIGFDRTTYRELRNGRQVEVTEEYDRGKGARHDWLWEKLFSLCSGAKDENVQLRAVNSALEKGWPEYRPAPASMKMAMGVAIGDTSGGPPGGLTIIQEVLRIPGPPGGQPIDVGGASPRYALTGAEVGNPALAETVAIEGEQAIRRAADPTGEPCYPSDSLKRDQVDKVAHAKIVRHLGAFVEAEQGPNGAAARMAQRRRDQGLT